MEIIKTRKDKPPRILIHADHGLGKSSLAAAAPAPLFIQTEDGLENIDADAFPLAQTYEQVLINLTAVFEEEHDYQTIIIDSLDWTERLIFKQLCELHDKESISEFGYGSGYAMALEQFNRLVKALTAIREERNMNVILIAHSQVKAYQNPMGADYDRHQIKLRDKNAELFLEWVDLAGYMHFQTFTQKQEGGFQADRHKAVGGSERVLSCAPSAAYVSKNRFGITQSIPLPSPEEGWNNLIKAIKQGA